jgi:hypothetical protein
MSRQRLLSSTKVVNAITCLYEEGCHKITIDDDTFNLAIQGRDDDVAPFLDTVDKARLLSDLECRVSALKTELGVTTYDPRVRVSVSETVPLEDSPNRRYLLSLETKALLDSAVVEQFKGKICDFMTFDPFQGFGDFNTNYNSLEFQRAILKYSEKRQTISSYVKTEHLMRRAFLDFRLHQIAEIAKSNAFKLTSMIPRQNMSRANVMYWLLRDQGVDYLGGENERAMTYKEIITDIPLGRSLKGRVIANLSSGIFRKTIYIHQNNS